jgi:HemY protein
MKAYRWLLWALAMAVLGSVLVWAIGTDPGYVLVQWKPAQQHQISIESTLVFAVLALFSLGLFIGLSFWVVRWPLRAMRQRKRQRISHQYTRAVLAFFEGRLSSAERLFAASSRLPILRTPAILGAALVSLQKEDSKRFSTWVQKSEKIMGAEQSALLLRAQSEWNEGRPGVVIELLAPIEQKNQLSPRGVQLLIDSLCLRGRAREGLALLSRLARSQMLSASQISAYETRTIEQALKQASDATNLRTLWADLHRGHKQNSDIALVFAQRAMTLGLGETQISEIESVLNKNWSNSLVLAWVKLAVTRYDDHLRTAEQWLKVHPNSFGLLIALGRLCRLQNLWGKSEDFLQRALSLESTELAWEELGQLYFAQNDTARAAGAWRNALNIIHGDPALPLTARYKAGELMDASPASEERNEHGVPVLSQR